MSRFVFASIAHPEKYGYAFDSDSYSGNTVYSCFRMFETMGDGLTQHSGDWSVTWEYVIDYLYSLASAMQTDDDLIAATAYAVTRKPLTEAIEFAASVVWKDSDDNYDKRRFYSLEQRKIGGRAKQYDKRYKEISVYQDGTRASILNMVTPDYADGLMRFQYAMAVNEYSFNQKKSIPEGNNLPIWFEGDSSKRLHLRNALRACQNLVEARQSKLDSTWLLQNYARMIAREAEDSESSAA